jgi:hypothetical protein
MKTDAAQSNVVLAWLWILLGFVSGLVLGLFFRREDWLGGYGSFKRRMYRLAHISFFGLGAVNLLFWLTVKSLPASSPLLAVTSWAFVVGAITMPVCCGLMAHWPKLHLLFSVPVASLIMGGVLTLAVLVHGESSDTANRGGRFSLTPALSHWEMGQPAPVLLYATDPSTGYAARNVESRQTILPAHEPPHASGRDAFHRVPNFFPEKWGRGWNASLPGSRRHCTKSSSGNSLSAGEGRGEGEPFESPLLSRTSNQSIPTHFNLLQP